MRGGRFTLSGSHLATDPAERPSQAAIWKQQLAALDGPVVVYGTSITQGANASRPGMAYTNILSRRLNVEFVNLGFSGSGRGEPEVAEVIAGIPNPLEPLRLLRMLVLVVATALALISMMFLLMVRVSDPLVPRAIFGVLNTVLFFPSGAVYPTAAFPAWMKAITVVDPFTYAVHGFKNLVLKNTGLMAIAPDLLFLLIFSALAMGAATLLFRRTL